MKFYLPGMFFQSHRTHEKRLSLEAAFNQIGMEPVASFSIDCKAILIGDRCVLDPRVYPDTRRLIENSGLPVIQYISDLYECNVHGNEPGYWLDYIQFIVKADRVLVPSLTTGKRVKEYSNKDSYVVKFPVHPWDKITNYPDDLKFKGLVVDVMRAYPDPNINMVSEACNQLGIPCLASRTSLPWDLFRYVVQNAKLLISTYKEASTGGLTLIEGLWHGIPSLCCNSPYNGVSEYMGHRGSYFEWNNLEDLKKRITDMLTNPPEMPSEELRREWITREYSDNTFAVRLSQHLKDVVV